MPSLTDHKELADTLAALRALKTSSLMLHMGDDSQRLVKTVIELVDGIRRGTQPQVNIMQTNPFLSKIVELLPLFITFTEKKGSSSKLSTVSRGPKALKLKLQHVLDLNNKGEAGFDDLTDFHAYMWLLDPAEQTKVNNVTQSLVGGMRVKRSGTELSDSKKPKKQRTGSKASIVKLEGLNDEVACDVASLFD
eukprot:NODE_23305_length_671_cov_15.992647.p1 GENE.NODE_23305_length_671_cov_15.992647~~NODE_23305_length_671_cov_15.992647.p1  ORF type:complete len:193 (+),score=65.52 NODE_23305_length_671_cov_15.992647:2-580(+)